MKAVLEIVTAIIFITGVITIPVWVADKIRNEALTKVSNGLTPIATLTSQLTKKFNQKR